MGKIIEFGANARRKVLRGMTEANHAVRSTIGPKGRPAILDNKTAHPVITKDGISVLDFIEFSDKYKQIGLNIIRGATRKVNGECGDGSTTTTLLTTELCVEGNRLIDQDFDAIDIKKGFQRAADDMIRVLKEQRTMPKDENDLLHIATISANNDEEIGEIIKEAFVNVGEDGIVNATINPNKTGKTEIEYSSGLEINRGCFTEACANQDNNVCKLNNPLYFIYGKLLERSDIVEPIYQIAQNMSRPLVIVAPAYSDDFKISFIQVINTGKMKNTVAIGPDGASADIMNERLKDIAVHVGAKIYEGKFGESLDTFNAKGLGSSEYITVTGTKRTVITNGAGKEEDVEKYITALKKKIADNVNATDDEFMSDYEIRNINERIASLSGGIATIKIGGFTDIEIKEKKDRFEDAINAVNAAISDGVLPGGGAGLLHAVSTIQKQHNRLENATQEKGYQSFLKVMEEPARMIISSTGKDPGYYIEKIKKSRNLNYGFNAKTEEECKNMYEAGVIDPAKVEIYAITYANSIAGTFITTDCIITSDADNCSLTANDSMIDNEREDEGYIC